MKGLYKINDTTKTATEGSTWLGPGIHENIEIVDVKAEISKTGKPYLALYAENEYGDRVSSTEWPMNFSKDIEDMKDDERKRALAALENQMSKIKQIVNIFKPGLNVETESFEELTKEVVNHLGDSYKGVKIRLKVVYDNRGFTTFAQKGLTNNVFIEPMTISKEDSRIRILPFDQMERTLSKDVEKLETNPLDETDTSSNDATNNSKKDDSPF